MAQIETNGAGKIISNVIELRWGLILKTTRIYEILNELNLSYQDDSILIEYQKNVFNRRNNS